MSHRAVEIYQHCIRVSDGLGVDADGPEDGNNTALKPLGKPANRCFTAASPLYPYAIAANRFCVVIGNVGAVSFLHRLGAEVVAFSDQPLIVGLAATTEYSATRSGLRRWEPEPGVGTERCHRGLDPVVVLNAVAYTAVIDARTSAFSAHGLHAVP